MARRCSVPRRPCDARCACAESRPAAVLGSELRTAVEKLTSRSWGRADPCLTLRLALSCLASCIGGLDAAPPLTTTDVGGFGVTLVPPAFRKPSTDRRCCVASPISSSGLA